MPAAALLQVTSKTREQVRIHAGTSGDQLAVMSISTDSTDLTFHMSCAYLTDLIEELDRIRKDLVAHGEYDYHDRTPVSRQMTPREIKDRERGLASAPPVREAREIINPRLAHVIEAI
jgi:hypothetical protein